MRAAVVFVVVLLGIVFATTPIDQAKITSLPGLDFTPSFDQYSGYITLEGTTKNIFYWFITAQTNPSSAPVLLWLQGGPGCSGLGDGLLLEHGPFSPYSPDGSKVNLESRFFSWNKQANIIYVESPCGVGFSYGESDSDYRTNDNQTALDNYLFLQGFFDVYTDWADNEFWITGESYGGVYITTLAYQVLNNNSDSQLQSNLKRGGLMLGNPVTNCDTPAYTGTNNVLSLDTQVGMFYWHGMVSRDNYDEWTSNQCNTANPPSSAKCETLYATIVAGVGNLDQPLALEMRDSVLAERVLREVRQVREADVFAPVPNAAVNPDMLYYSYCTGNGTLDFNVASVPNCFGLDDQVDTYLNTASVQTAIHAKPAKWEECGGVVYDKTVGSVIPYLENFFQVAPNMRILYYSGDIDIATVPFAQTQRCLETMSRPITAPWRPYVINSEVAGYVEVYDTYTYATVKAAGHEAPQYQAEANYVLFSSFLNNQDLPK